MDSRSDHLLEILAVRLIDLPGRNAVPNGSSLLDVENVDGKHAVCVPANPGLGAVACVALAPPVNKHIGLEGCVRKEFVRYSDDFFTLIDDP